MGLKEINKALKKNFKELDRAYLNTVESLDARLLASYKTALVDVKKQVAGVYEKFGNNPSITQVRKYDRLQTIEQDMTNRIAELDREVRNVISSTMKNVATASYTSTVNGINQGMDFNFTSAMLNEEGLKNFLGDTLWTDAMKNGSAELLTGVKREFETVLRANAREEVISGVAQGKSYADISKSLQERFNIGAKRAKTIATTETHKAHSYGREAGVSTAMTNAKELGVEAHKVWRHNGVGEPRPDHVAATGQFADKDGYFHVGGEKLFAPGLGSDPANNINCHCSEEFEIADNLDNSEAMDILESKADDAKIIFEEDFGTKSRAEILKRFQDEAGLTKAGASTYYQNLKRAREGGNMYITKAKVPAVPKVPATSKVPVTKGSKKVKFNDRVFTEKEFLATATKEDIKLWRNDFYDEWNVNLAYQKEAYETVTKGDLQTLSKSLSDAFKDMERTSDWYKLNGLETRKHLGTVTLEKLPYVKYAGAKSDRIWAYYSPWNSSIHQSTLMKVNEEIAGNLTGYVVEVLRASQPLTEQLTLRGHNVSKGFRSTFRHEYGHHLEEYLMSSGAKAGMTGTAKRDFFKLFDDMGGKGSLKWKKVSHYGSSKNTEAFAESFCAITNYDYGAVAYKRMPKEIEDWWVEILEIPESITSKWK